LYGRYSPYSQAIFGSRTRVGRGSAPLPGIDGRSREARRYKELFYFYRDQAPRNDELARQLAGLILQREQLDAALARGEAVDPFHQVRIASCINRTLARLRALAGGPEADRRRLEEDKAALLRV